MTGVQTCALPISLEICGEENRNKINVSVRVSGGKFEGQVNTSDTLVIGETGDMKAELKVGTLVCKGRLNGGVVASKKVEMHPASKIKGDIQTPALSIALGALIDGNLDMTGGESKKVVNLVQEKK